MTTDITHKYNGMDELLPWLFIADEECSVIVNKDSSLMAAWSFEGIDVESGDDTALDETSMAFDAVLRNLGDNLPVIWTRVDRRPDNNYQYGEFDSDCDIASGIDGVWGDSFDNSNLFSNIHHIALSMPVSGGGAMSVGEMTRHYIDSGQKPHTALFSALKNKYIGGQKRFGFVTRRELDVTLSRFEQSCCSPIDNGHIGLEVTRLKGGELLGFLKSTASASPKHPVAVDHTEYLDAYLSDTMIDNRYSDSLKLEGTHIKYVATYSLKKAPHAEAQQVLNSLMAIPASISITNCWKTMSQSDSESFLSGARTFDELRSMELKSLVKMAFSQDGSGTSDNEPKTEVGRAAMDIKHEVKQRRAVCGWMSSVVTVYADSLEELDTSCELVNRILEQSGLVFIREREGNLSAFCTGIPGQMSEPVRWHFTEAANLTDISPIITLMSGAPYHPYFSEGKDSPVPPNAIFRTRWNTPFNFNYHTGQLGHTLLIGPSRNGKTMLQMFLESQFLKYENSRIFNIDKDYSCKPQTLLLGGEHIDLEPGRPSITMNPVSMAKDELGQAWLVGWLDRLMSSRGNRTTDKELNEIALAVKKAEKVSNARLSTIHQLLPHELKVRLQPWCSGNPWGSYFDNVDDTFSLSRITTVEVGGLLNAGLKEVVSAFTEYAFYRIERFLMNRREEDVGPTMIYMEEAGFFLDDEIFANKARDYLMTLAKKKAFLVMTAQSPEPFINHPKLGAAVRDNVATVIFMPNPKAAGQDLGGKYKEAFGVNENHLNLIATAIPREEYCIYHQLTGVFRVVKAKFPKEIVATLRSDVPSQAIFNRIYTKKDDSWKRLYIEALLRL